MGLVVPGCYEGGYGTFNAWREVVGEAAGWWYSPERSEEFPNGLYWLVDGSVDVEDSDPVSYLLGRNDCDDPVYGCIEAAMRRPLANAFEQLLPLLEPDPSGRNRWETVTRDFISGLRSGSEDIWFV